MSNNKVTNVANPTANGDAVNKKYVDDKATETETTLKEYVNEHSGGFENAAIVGLYDMTKTGSIPREANNDYLFIILPSTSSPDYGGAAATIRNGRNGSDFAIFWAGHHIVPSAGQFTFTGNGYVMVYRVAVTPVPVDPATKFNQIDLSNYVGSLSESTVNTASDFKDALQYILDNNPGKHFYYGTSNTGSIWYFASDTELSTLSNDSYICGNGVQNNGTTVYETFKMNKVVEPTPNLPDESGDYTEFMHNTTLSNDPDKKQTIINTMKDEQGAQSNPFEEYAMNIQKVTPTQLNTILNSTNLFNQKRKQIAKTDSDNANPGVWYGYGATAALKSIIHDGDTVYWLEDWNDYGNDHGSDNVFFVMIPTDDGNWNIATLWGTHD